MMMMMMTSVASDSLQFRNGATYLRYETNVLSTDDWSMFTTNTVRFGPLNCEQVPAGKKPLENVPSQIDESP